MANISTSSFEVMGKVCKKYSKTDIREEILADVKA